jgi:hypothetical protein
MDRNKGEKEKGKHSVYLIRDNPVHHLANIRQASAAFGVFDPALAIPPFLLRFDPLQKG